MSPDDERRPAGEPAPLSAEDEAAVARLLADAAEPVTMPPRVADRLDAVLAGLVAERAEAAEPEVARPVELARRRRWPRMMLAAAAVVIGGYGVTAALQPGGLTGSGGDAMSTADESVAGGAESADQGARESAGKSTDESSALADGRATSGSVQEPDAPRLLVLGPVRLRPDRLQEDVRRMLDGAPLTAGPPTSGSAECGPPALDDDESWVPSRYAGRRTVLVTDSGADGTVDASVYSCTGRLLASVTVDAP